MASKENIYFLRSFLLLIEGGSYISKEILKRESQKPENDLDELLKINERKLKHLFHGKQYNKLFPEFGKADIGSWDLQLSVGVLITVFGKHLELVEKEKLRALRDIRNDIYMHCTTVALDENEYDDVKEQLDNIITTLASTFDISVQQKCSKCIEQFTSGELDAVRPPLQTLNGFSQSCKEKLKVGVQTELVIGGPSADWISLCEHTLVTILNQADSMASDDGGFKEIEENVKKMLSFLECNKAAVLKECNRKCIILYFECKDYESFLKFLYRVEGQEYTSYLSDLSNSLHRFFKPRYPISITSQVTSESLQLVLIDIIKTLSNEEEERRHYVEISSDENSLENKTMASRDVNREAQLINRSETCLFLNIELISWEAVPQMLQSFQGREFSDSLKKVAGSLSRHYEAEITLKASMDVGAMLEALEESVNRETKKTESIYAIKSKEADVLLLPDDEKTFLADKVRIMKSVRFLREEHMVEHVIRILSKKSLLTPLDLKQVGITRTRNVDRFISKVLTRPMEFLNGFKHLQDQELQEIMRKINSKSVSINDIKVLSELEGSMTGRCIRPNGGKPLIKFTSQQRDLLLKELENANDIAASLLSMMVICGQEFLKINNQTTRIKSITILLNILEKCSEKNLDDFCSALKENGYKHFSKELVRTGRAERLYGHVSELLLHYNPYGGYGGYTDGKKVIPSSFEKRNPLGEISRNVVGPAKKKRRHTRDTQLRESLSARTLLGTEVAELN